MAKSDFDVRPWSGSVGGMQGNCRECQAPSTALDRNGRCWRHAGWQGSWAGVPRHAQQPRKESARERRASA
jgi:hypothetical protein